MNNSQLEQMVIYLEQKVYMLEQSNIMLHQHLNRVLSQMQPMHMVANPYYHTPQVYPPIPMYMSNPINNRGCFTDDYNVDPRHTSGNTITHNPREVVTSQPYPLFEMDAIINTRGDARVLVLPPLLYKELNALITGKCDFVGYLNNLLGTNKPFLDYIQVDESTAMVIYEGVGSESCYNGYYKLICKTFISDKVDIETLGVNYELRKLMEN